MKKRLILFIVLLITMSTITSGATEPAPWEPAPSMPGVTQWYKHSWGFNSIIGDAWRDYRVPVNTLIDTYGAINSSEQAQRTKSLIANLHAGGKKYIAYYSWLFAEGDMTGFPSLSTNRHEASSGNYNYSTLLDGTFRNLSVEGQSVNLSDPNLSDKLLAAGSTGNLNIAMPDFRNYLIEASKYAVDAGADIVAYDVAYLYEDEFHPALLLGFSHEGNTYPSFNTFLLNNYSDKLVTWQISQGNLADNTFDFRLFLQSKGYTNETFEQRINNYAYRALDNNNEGFIVAWARYMEGFQRAFAQALSDILKTHAQSLGQDLLLMANRAGAKGNLMKQWMFADIFDVLGSEIFSETDLSGIDAYYRFGASLGTQFWSWNKGYYAPERFMAETLATGGLTQVWDPAEGANGRIQNPINDTLASYYEVMQKYPELRGNAPLYDVGMWYFPYNNTTDEQFRGLAALLGDINVSYRTIGKPGEGALFGPAFNLSADELTKTNMLIVPSRTFITPEIATLLVSYVDAGGRLILYGSPSSTTLEETLVGAGQGWVAYGDGWTVEMGSNMASYLTSPSASSREDLISCFEDAGLTAQRVVREIDNTPSLNGTIRSYPYHFADGSALIHFVNRQISVTGGSYNETTPVSSTERVRLRLLSTFNHNPLSVQWVDTVNNLAKPLDITDYTYDENSKTIDVTLPTAWKAWGALKIGSPINVQGLPNRPPMSQALDVETYDYWNYQSQQLDVSFAVRDDSYGEGNEAQVALYYRHSTDNTNFSAWQLAGTKSCVIPEVYTEAEDGTRNDIHVYSFSPSQNGYYQFYALATDIGGVTEIKSATAESSRGFDGDNPHYITAEEITAWSNGAETSIRTGIWQQATAAPTFKWAAPDSFAPFERYMISWMDRDGNELLNTFILAADLAQGFTPTAPAAGIQDGEEYRLVISTRKITGATPETQPSTYLFRYGSLPVQPAESVQIEAQGGQLKVSWSNPSDANFDSTRIYWRTMGNPAWQGGGSQNSPASIANLDNDTPYEVMIATVSKTAWEGDQVVYNNSGNGYVLSSVLLGDVNLDGFVNAADIVPINRHALGIESITNDLSLQAADVNKDGFVNAADIVPINRHALGIEQLE